MVESTQVRDSSGTVRDPAVEEKQFQQDTHWQTVLSASGVIKAEESGKVVVLTDIWILCNTAAGPDYGQIRQGGAAGTAILHFSDATQTCISHSFRQGLEGAAYDGSNAGDLYFTLGGGSVGITFTGYMRDA